MAIKINGKDLAKRIINGVEVEKVIRNGVQIRPDSPTPTDIHIHADFTNYSMPSGWIYGSQNFTYTDKGLLSTETGQGSSYVQYRPNWQTPTFDLSGAKRIVTVGKIYYVPSSNPAHDEFIYWQWGNFVFAAIAGCSMLDPEINSVGLKFPLDSTYVDSAQFIGMTEGYATGTLEADLQTGFVEYSFQGTGISTGFTLVDTLSASQLATLKQQTEFLITFRAQAIVSEQDIYIYY